MRRPTIHAVAQRAQVAVSTVSRVLNGGYASEAASARVLTAVRALGYTPSVTAQSLVSGRAGCIGVVSHTSQTSWFSQLLLGIEEALVDARRSLLLSSLAINDRYDTSAVASWVHNRRVDGLIFVRYTQREQPLFRSARAAGMPVVLIGPDARAPVHRVVRCDNLAGGGLVAAHLLELGHSRIAFVGGPKESIDTRDRLRGLAQGLAQGGVFLSEARTAFAANYTHRPGAEFGRAFLRESRRPSAVVFGNDAMALGFLREVLQAGLRVPEDVSVIGFDGVPEGALYWPGLTTVLQPARRMGESGALALLEGLAHPSAKRGKDISYAVQLIVRESTGPPRRGLT